MATVGVKEYFVCVRSSLQRRVTGEDGFVPDGRAGSLVEPRPLLPEHVVEVWHVDERSKQVGEVWWMIGLRDQRCLQGTTWTDTTECTGLATDAAPAPVSVEPLRENSSSKHSTSSTA